MRSSPLERGSPLPKIVRHLKPILTTIRDTAKKPMGRAGLAIIAIYALMALVAPYITYNDPVKDLNLASDMAMPEWITLFPGYSSLPRNTIYNFEPAKWELRNVSRGGAYEIRVDRGSDILTIRLNSLEKPTPGTSKQGRALLDMEQEFEYSYSPPKSFILTARINLTYTGLSEKLRFTIYISNGTNKYILYDTGYIYSGSISRWQNPLLISSDFPQIKELNNISIKENLAKMVFSNPGEYRIGLFIEISPEETGEGGARTLGTIAIGNATLKIPGLVYGMLGTNYVGADVWSQFVWGIRQSLLVGIIASTVSVAIGVLLGVLIGYSGRALREVLLLLTDTIYLLPLLPIILITLAVVGRNIYVVAMLIGLLTWAGLSRELGNWMLSLRERAHVEAAKALGASQLYILLKHVLPFTTHLIIFAFIIRIPFSILLEAGLSIIGFGDPFQPSWGKMINEALSGGALISGAWWWIAPPVIGLVSLSAGFVYLGYALDEILNPRLKEGRHE
jgi:ABC-type dipeptide/oligopeptide/nickel transport system permease subunit